MASEELRNAFEGYADKRYAKKKEAISPTQAGNLISERIKHEIKVGNTTTGQAGDNASVTKRDDGTGIAFDFTIPRGPAGPRGPVGPQGPAGSGTGTSYSITLPSGNSGTINGGYCVSLIDYRELAQNPYFAVNGKRLYTRDKRTLPKGVARKHYAGPFLGIQESEKIILTRTNHIDYSSNAPDISKALLVIQTELANDGAGEIKVPSDNPNVEHIESNSALTPNTYGNYYIALGGEDKPFNVDMTLKMFYTDTDNHDQNIHLQPKGLGRDFQFINYNGIELRSNGKDKDVYTKGDLADTVQRKVGVANFKDLKHIRPEEVNENGGFGPDIIMIQVPDDMKVPEGLPQASSYDFTKIKVNNISIVPHDNDSGAETKPFLNDELAPLVLKNGKTVWCFQLSILKGYGHKWYQHLVQTQIIYPLATPKTFNVPDTGYIVNLSNGSSIKSWRYGKVTSENGVAKFSQSPFGDPDIDVQMSQIVSINKNKKA